MHVFVYGTLKRGYGANHFLGTSNYLGKAVVKGFQLYNPYPFPYAIEEEGMIIGELYEINERTLWTLDGLEGYPYHYNRKLVEKTGRDVAKEQKRINGKHN